jgi:hypothetical protein
MSSRRENCSSRPSQNPACGFPAPGSSNRFTDLSLIVDSVSLTIYLPVLCPSIVSPPRYICLSSPSLLRYYPVSSVLWVDPTTYAPSSDLRLLGFEYPYHPVQSLYLKRFVLLPLAHTAPGANRLGFGQRAPINPHIKIELSLRFIMENIGSPKSLHNPLDSMPRPHTPVESPPSRLLAMPSLLSSVSLITLTYSTTSSFSELDRPHPIMDCGLLPPCLRFTHTVTRIGAKLGTGCWLNFTRLAFQPTGPCKFSWRTKDLTPTLLQCQGLTLMLRV